MFSLRLVSWFPSFLRFVLSFSYCLSSWTTCTISYFLLTIVLWLLKKKKERWVDNLKKRWVIIIGWCCMWTTAREILDHELFHCPVSHDLWSFVFWSSLFWVQWVMPQTVAGLLACWKGRFGRCWNINLGHDITLSFVEHLKVSWEMPDILRIVRILFYIWNFH